MGASNEILFNFLQVFADLRRNGCNRRNAWEFTHQRAAERLDRSSLKRLHKMAHEWERIEGYKYPTHSSGNVPAHVIAAQNNIRAFATPTEQPAYVGGYEMPLFQNEPTDAGIVSDDLSITDILDSETSTTPGYFPANSRLLVYIRQHPHPLIYKPDAGSELLVGRGTPDSALVPDIDLSRFGGEQQGVSRMHAAINQQGTTLFISDLGSRSSTSINGLKLKPRQTRVLNHGDQVVFGGLPTHIKFYRAAS